MEESRAENGKRKKAALIIFALTGMVGAVVLYFYLGYKATHISTDDAFIEGRIHPVAPKVPGTVREVYVKDNQRVKRGDLLLEIDSADYDVRVREMESGLQEERAKLVEVGARTEAVRKKLAELKAAVGTAKAQLQVQEANLSQAGRDVKRAESLYRREAVSKERYEKMRTSYEVCLAQVRAAQEQMKQAETAVEAQKAVVKQVESSALTQAASMRQKAARLRSAELTAGYTKVYAPSDGFVTRKAVEQGTQVQAGQPLMAVTELDDIWVVANYKETQLRKIRPGQRVTITVDTYPGQEFRGTVDSIMAGTGSVFSLFPPENATGQFVKVVQRIPVKIVFDRDTDRQHVLRVGMSVEPTVVIK
ncbi:MAG: HlyD family secretion protein [Alphaproteobacteria bacterium]|uniref:HlyD family secretion protein n=1 Tax=Candidatus Nitrobium versatile TaxID=2884831 RepID=A0A953LZF5_9BACT|nr:HlyD family secretion protein [Candidatus Nitrobium versatile]